MFRVLGPLEADIGGSLLRLSSPRQRALLSLLLLTPQRVVSIGSIVDAIWEEQVPANPANAVQLLVTRLRRSLQDDGKLIVTRPPGYLLAVDADQIDAGRFEQGCRRGQQLLAGDPQQAVAVLDDTLALWRGPPYAEFAHGFAGPEATRLDEWHLAAQEHRILAALQVGAVGDAVSRAGALAAANPLRERPVELLMRALHADGRTGDALAAYQRYRAATEQELGLDPSALLQDLESRILRDELPPLARARERHAEQLGSEPQPVEATPGAAEGTGPLRVAPPPSRRSVLIGREDQLRQLEAMLARHRLVTITGPGGVGKTALATALVSQLNREASPETGQLMRLDSTVSLSADGTDETRLSLGTATGSGSVEASAHLCQLAGLDS